MALSRSEQRGHFDIPTRLTLLEGDVDKHDKDMTEFAEGQRRILWAVIGLLISVTTAAILLALNLIVQGAHP